MANRIRSDQPLYQYVFDTEGFVTFRRCCIVSITPMRIFENGRYVNDPENNRIAYEPEKDANASSERFYVEEACIDRKIASAYNRKVVVLSEPNDVLARDILVQYLEERLSEYEKFAESMRRQIKQLTEQEML